MLGGIDAHNRVAIRRKNQLGQDGQISAPTQSSLPGDAGEANVVPTAHESAPPAAASATNQENAATMLEVHAPHKIVHTWKDFLIHIATIVVGLLIAVGLEQTVEFFHHRHQRNQLSEALQRDGEANRAAIKDNIAVAQRIMDWSLEQAKTLERAGSTGPLTLRRKPTGTIYATDAGVWLSAKAGGLTSLLPTGAQNWLEYLDDVYRQTFVSHDSALGQLDRSYAALNQAIVGQATETPSGELDLSTLTPEQRSTAITCLRTIAEQARALMRSLVTYDVGNEYILLTPRDQLDDPRAEQRYMAIARQKAEAHPALEYIFNAK
jgi:hypothetical protein